MLKLISNFGFNFNLSRYTEVCMILNEAYDVLMDETERKVYDQAGRCRLTVSKPVLKAPMVSALETIIW